MTNNCYNFGHLLSAAILHCYILEIKSTKHDEISVFTPEESNLRPGNAMLNFTTKPIDAANVLQMAVIATLLILLIISCIVGNLFVIAAILVERNLRNRPQYYLVFSLAVADLLVGLIVTPLGAWSTLFHAWTLSVALCDFWISIDVLVCTSSILHLVAIGLDRYWSVTDVCYVQNRTPRRIFTMLGIIWLISLLISLAPMLGWKDSDFYRRVKEQSVCLISQQISYQVFSTVTAFYIPLCAIICIYYKIMRAAKRRFKRERDRRGVIVSCLSNSYLEQKKHEKVCKFNFLAIITSHNSTTAKTTTLSNLRSTEDGCSYQTTKLKCISNSPSKDENTLINGEQSVENDLLSTETQTARTNNKDKKKVSTFWKTKQSKCSGENSEMKRERKAWRTLVIITGTFVACWTPFFLVSVYRPLCRCRIPVLLESVTNWLGYLNSALNPIIYTVFSRDFRAAFKRILSRLLFFSKSQQ